MVEGQNAGDAPRLAQLRTREKGLHRRGHFQDGAAWLADPVQHRLPLRIGAVDPNEDRVPLRVPLAPIAGDHLEILAEGLRKAFNDIRADSPDTVAAGHEPEVTALMQARLNRLIDEDPLWRQLVLCVARGTESISFDGSHLEKRPDLSIVLSGADRRFPLIAEAKILDAATSKTIRLYCENGIRRFVQGEYAWGNREAFMIGYVRDGSSIDPTLKAFLSNAATSDSDVYLVQALPAPIGTGLSDLAYTLHGRSFAYGNQSPPKTPGPISLWHLWLS